MSLVYRKGVWLVITHAVKFDPVQAQFFFFETVNSTPFISRPVKLCFAFYNNNNNNNFIICIAGKLVVAGQDKYTNNIY